METCFLFICDDSFCFDTPICIWLYFSSIYNSIQFFCVCECARAFVIFCCSCHLCKNALCRDSHLQCKVHLIVLVWVCVVFFVYFSFWPRLFSMHLTIFGGNFMTIFAAQITAHSVYSDCELSRIYCWLVSPAFFGYSSYSIDVVAVFLSLSQQVDVFECRKKRSQTHFRDFELNLWQEMLNIFFKN